MKKTFYLMIIAALALAFVNVSFADEAKEAQTDAPKVEKKEPVFNASVPEEGSVEEYFAFIKKVQSRENLMAKPEIKSYMEYMGRKVAICNACIKAADKVLSKDSLTDEQKKDAIKFKVAAFIQLEKMDSRCQGEFPALIKLCQDNGLGDLADILAEKLIVQDFVDAFMSARGEGNDDNAKKVLNEMVERVVQKGKKVSLDLASGVGFVLQFIPEMYEPDQVDAIYSKVIETLVNAEDSDVVWEGRGLRRQNLPGNEMLVGGKFIDDTEYKAEDYAGKTVLIDFWATWCGPCRGEIPNVKKLYAFYHEKGFEIIGISSDRDVETLKKFTEREGMPWKQMMRNDALVADGQTMGVYYGVTGIPTMILIGPDGKVITVNARGQNLGKALEDIYGPMPKEDADEKDEE